MPRDIPVGNGCLLVNFDRYYTVRDIYWPHVGRHNHTDGAQCRFGVWVDGAFAWLDDPGWQRQLVYLEDTLVTRVVVEHQGLGIRIICNDFVDFHESVYLRRMEVVPVRDRQRQIRFFQAWDLSVDGTAIGDSAYYEPQRRALLHYKGRTWFLANGGVRRGDLLQIGIQQWAVGNKHINGLEGSWKDAEDGELSGNSVAQGSVDMVMGLTLTIAAGESGEAWLWLAVGEDFEQVTGINRSVRRKGPETLLARSRDYWRLWVDKEAEPFACLSRTTCGVSKRSLLILRTQIDNRGAILAANDHDFTQFGRDTYSYMWPRDGALVAAALVDLGYSEISRRFFAFCHRVITREGYLLHKYNPDGSLASSWHGWYHDGSKQLPIQQDETALVLWALWRHFARFRDVEFIKPHYRGLVLRAANWMVQYRDEATHLPLPSWDLWEERYGVHAWTVGAVWAGFIAAADFAESFGQLDTAAGYRRHAELLRQAVANSFWNREQKRFVRSLHSNNDGTLEQDLTLDASLVGLWYFGMFAADDPKIVRTMAAIRSQLWVQTEVGGLARYQNDYYHQISDDVDHIPGNPWFITTLWLAQWYIARAKNDGDLDPAAELIEWAASRALPSGVLAEQVHPHTNEPLSVSPLTWSHATLVVTVREFMAKVRGAGSDEQGGRG